MDASNRRRLRPPLIRCLLICSLLACWPIRFAPAADAGPRPRALVDQVAELIDDNYFDARRAHDIAAGLRMAASAGEFDACTRPRDLATTLTALLQPLDHHLRVLWSAPGNGAGSRGGRARPFAAEPLIADPRGSYGIRRVEILSGDIGYIELTAFADLHLEHQRYRGAVDAAGADPARAAVDAALQLTAGAAALIIDLRQNIGGSLDMGGYLISAFVSPTAEIYDVTHSRDGTQSDRPTLAYPTPRTDVPLYVLTSGQTASAAEAFAYTLQAAGRTVIVGDVSAGAAHSGGSFPLGDGLSLFVPVGTPVNPLTHTNWEGSGVQPDVRVDAEQALTRAQRLALKAVLARNPAGPQASYLRLVFEALHATGSTHPPGPPLSIYRGTYNSVVIEERDGELHVRQGNRIPMRLSRLQGDVFFDRSEPSRRIRFERDSHGDIDGLEIIYANGRVLWFPRQPLRVPPLAVGPS